MREGVSVRYRRLTQLTIDTAQRIAAEVQAIDGLRVLGEPDAHLLAIASTTVTRDTLTMRRTVVQCLK